MAKDRDYWAVASCGRPSSAGEFDSEHVRRLAQLAPHLRRATAISLRLTGANIRASSYVEVLDGIEQGVLIVAPDNTLSFANLAAECLLAQPDGLTVVNGRLQARSLGDTARLHGLIAAAVDGKKTARSGQAMAIARAMGRRPLTVLVVPLSLGSSWASQSPAALVFIGDPESMHAADSEQLRTLYGLTPAEASVAIAAAHGDGLQAIADQMGIGLTTARTHLQRVFGKTGTGRQAELVRLIADSSPGVRPFLQDTRDRDRGEITQKLGMLSGTAKPGGPEVCLGS